MYNKTIKKSIVIIITTTLLFTCFSSSAASIATEYITVAVNNQYVIAPSQVIDESPNRYLAVYDCVVQMDLQISETAFYNGSLAFRVNFPVNGVTILECNTYINNSVDIGNGANFMALARYLGPNARGTRISMYFNNWYARTGYQAGPELHIQLIISSATNNFNVLAFEFSMSDAAGTVTKSANPDYSVGMAKVMADSVIYAMNHSELLTDVDALLIFAASQEGLLEDILDELETSNIYLGDILYYLQNTQNPRLNTIISKIQELIDMGRNDTQAANELGAAAQQMNQAANAMNVSKPNIDAVIPETLLAADAAQAQGEIFSWLNNGYITAILVACFTIALIGFVLYGKSG